jgi:sugar phosphate isomerase/epimerase
MTNPAAGFGVNTYSYTFSGSAADTVARLADQGYGGVELMFFPGHLWPTELDAGQLRGLRQLCEQRLRLVAVNMPNVDINVAAAAAEMRAYTLDLLTKFVRCAGELGAGGIIVGPGKPIRCFRCRASAWSPISIARSTCWRHWRGRPARNC